MGKDYLTDILESKRTLMVIHCLSSAGAGRPASGWWSCCSWGTARRWSRRAEVVDLLNRYGSVDYARAYGARADRRRPARILDGAPRHPAPGTCSASMADFFLEREK